MSPSPAIRLLETERYLRTLREGAQPGTLLDVRYRTSKDRLSRFFLDWDTPDNARTIMRLGQRTDVYVGCAPRQRRRGRREDVAPTPLLWADIDTPAAAAALKAFPCPPNMIVYSGSTSPEHKHAHAYWALTRRLSVEELERTNQRLAAALGADPKCADAARILRPPGTNNFKDAPPHPVELAETSSKRYRPIEILAALPAPTSPNLTPTARQVQRRERSGRGSDPLQRIDPPDYVRHLTGRDAAPNSKVACPFHPDDTPSLHVYPTPEEGWTCYGCPTPDGRRPGGDIYNFASSLWGIPTQGRDFIELRHRLDDAFSIER